MNLTPWKEAVLGVRGKELVALELLDPFFLEVQLLICPLFVVYFFNPSLNSVS